MLIMDLYIMRHGETEWNNLGLIQGSVDIPLNDRGIALAEQTRDGFQNDGIRFDRIFTSPLQRAEKTAEIILDGVDIPLLVDSRIREMGFGPYEGMKVRERRTNPAYREFNKCFDDPVHYRAEGSAEGYEEVFARVGSFLEEAVLPLEHSCENVLVVCHGAVIRAFISLIKELPLWEYWSGIHVQNCSVHIARVTDGKLEMVEQNRLYYQPEPRPERGFV